MSVTSKRNGFTIVELLIVIVVIGILAAISLVAFSGVQYRAQVSASKADYANIKKLVSTRSVISDNINMSKADFISIGGSNILAKSNWGNESTTVTKKRYRLNSGSSGSYSYMYLEYWDYDASHWKTTVFEYSPAGLREINSPVQDDNGSGSNIACTKATLQECNPAAE